MSSEAQGGQAHEEQAGELRRLRRSPRSRLVAGVCGGLAEYFGLHPAIYRVIFVALTIAGGTGLLLYAAAALVMPVEGSDESLATQALREHRDRPWLVIGIALLALGGIFVLSGPHVLWGAGGGIWALALIAGAVIVLWEASGRGRSRRVAADGTTVELGGRDTRPSIFWPGLGVLLAAAGVVGLLDVLDVADIDWRAVLAGGVILAGALVALGFFWRGAAPLGVIGFVLAIAMAGTLALRDVSLRGGVGDRVVRPESLGDLENAYRLGIGQLELDLRALQLPPGETRVAARVGIGELDVDVPEGVALEVNGKVHGGDANILGRKESGWRFRKRVVDPGAEKATRRLVLDVDVGLGDLEVRH